MLYIQPTFFAPVAQYVLFANAPDLVFEVQDNFQKQTFRNRCYIYGANGKQLLTVPIVHAKGSGRQKTRDIKIERSFNWQRNMIKSLESSYRSSPYFEYYEDDILKVFNKKHEFLLDLNLYSHEIISESLSLENKISFTDTYNVDVEKDFRYLVNAKTENPFKFSKYTQVFDDKYGFINNLSILDLLFNEGTNALNYLVENKAVLL